MTCASFNWATPRTGWKGGPRVRPLFIMTLASIGPPRERGGKLVDQDLCPRGRGVASIGPPRERGGKVKIFVIVAIAFRVLQLGHPANGVERSIIHGSVIGLGGGFNWATPRTGWKGGILGPLTIPPLASIGPPRERGGKREGPLVLPQDCPLQLGHPANGVERRSVCIG